MIIREQEGDVWLFASGRVSPCTSQRCLVEGLRSFSPASGTVYLEDCNLFLGAEAGSVAKPLTLGLHPYREFAFS